MISEWHKSSTSGDLHCVEVGQDDDGTVMVRDTKAPDDAVMTTSPEAWAEFIADVRAGKHDL